jgi:hypothetical protein
VPIAGSVLLLLPFAILSVVEEPALSEAEWEPVFDFGC